MHCFIYIFPFSLLIQKISFPSPFDVFTGFFVVASFHPIYIYVFCIALHFTFKKHQISETACIKGRFKHASNETKMFITRVVILKSFLYFFQVFNRYRLLLFKSGNTFEVIKMFWSTEFVLKHILYLEFHKLSSKSKHVVVLSRITLKVTFIDT